MSRKKNSFRHLNLETVREKRWNQDSAELNGPPNEPSLPEVILSASAVNEGASTSSSTTSTSSPHSTPRFCKKLELSASSVQEASTPNNMVSRTIVDMSEICNLVSQLACPECHGKLSAEINNQAKRGLVQHIKVNCCVCNKTVASTYTSSVDEHNSFSVNKVAVLSSLLSGMGPYKFNYFAQNMDMPGLHQKTFSTIAKNFYLQTPELAKLIFDHAAKLARSVNCAQSNQPYHEYTRDGQKEAAEFLTPLLKIWEKHAESVTKLEEEVKVIPSILTMMTQLHTLLDGLSEGFMAAERELDLLEDMCEEQEFQRRCLEEQKKLALYRIQKEAEAERIKVELAQTHAKRMADLELAKKKNLQERAEAFTSAFQNDLDFYRTHGHAGRIPTEFPKVSSLSEIVLDEDKQALDSFLGPNGETDGSTGSLELSGEGAYIEDDYTTDFSVKQDMDFLEDSNYSSTTVISQLEIADDDDGDLIHPQNTETSDIPVHSGHLQSQENSAETTESNTDFRTTSCLQTFPTDIQNHEDKQEGISEATEGLATISQNTDVAVT